MKRFSVFFSILYIAGFCVTQPVPAQIPAGEFFRQEGIASWYGPEFDGRPTSSGEIFDSTLFTAAHPTLPFGTVLVVTNRHNNRQVSVKVNDRGPFVPARIIDVSRAAAIQLDMLTTGTAPVVIETIERIVLPYIVPEPAPVQPPVSLPAQPIAQPPAQTVLPVPQITQPVQVTSPPAFSQPLAVPEYQPVASGVKLTPDITPVPNKMYKLQIGSYKVARNAVDAYEKLKNAGLNPAYERNGDYFRVVLAGIRGTEVQLVTEKLGLAGFKEAVIRVENQN